MGWRISHDVFRERVQEVLRRSGLSYAAFARKAGLDRSTLSQLLTGPMPRLPRAETLAMIAKTAHVSVDWLLGLSQREEMGAEIVEAMIHIAPYPKAPSDASYLGWLKAAQGMRVCSVPVDLPDILKTARVLEVEFPASFAEGQALESLALRLDWMRSPYQQLEIAASRQAIENFAAGFGRWRGLGAAERREQLEVMIARAEEFYPAMRIYLYDCEAVYSVPFTVFGPQRAVLFLGASYLVLNSAPHIQMFASRFDALIRAADIQPHQFSAFIARLRDAAP